MDKEKLENAITLHAQWLETDGHQSRRADFIDSDLRQADLRGTDLRYARCAGVNLERAELAGARLAYANLSFAAQTTPTINSRREDDRALSTGKVGTSQFRQELGQHIRLEIDPIPDAMYVQIGAISTILFKGPSTKVCRQCGDCLICSLMLMIHQKKFPANRLSDVVAL